MRLDGAGEDLELDVAIGVDREHLGHCRLSVLAAHRYVAASNRDGLGTGPSRQRMSLARMRSERSGSTNVKCECSKVASSAKPPLRKRPKLDSCTWA